MCYDGNDISPAVWVETECKTMVSFKYKSTLLSISKVIPFTLIVAATVLSDEVTVFLISHSLCDIVISVVEDYS